MQHVQVEHSELINQVDVVRDSALDLMNRSDKYHQLVEPELTALNQHWEEVSTRLKVRANVCFIRQVFPSLSFSTGRW